MTSHSRRLIGLAALGITLLAGCTTTPTLTVPGNLVLPPKVEIIQPGEIEAGKTDNRPQKLTVSETPRIGQSGPSTAGVNIRDDLPPMYGGPVNVNVQNVPVPVFANEVFGNLLDLNVNMAPEVASLQELVTLRTESRQKPRDLFILARQVLAEYGVIVTVEGKLVRLVKGTAGASVTPPLIISGRASPVVPLSHRPVFQLVELEVVRTGDAIRWLSTLFGTDVKVDAEAERNSLIISGKPAQVRQAIDALRVFDRPLMRGRISARVEPAFLGAQELSTQLIQVMNTQGYSATSGPGSPASIIVLPVAAANSVLIFSSTQQVLDYAVSWARELDRPSQKAGTQSLFYYQVKNTKASDLASVLNGGSTAASAPPPTAAAAAGQPPAATRNQPPASGNLQVDEPRNALIYQGDPSQWERMLTLIKQMDRAPRQVMIEVTIAEVSLTDDNDFGLSWFAKNGFGRFNGRAWSGEGSGGTSAGGGGNGLTYLLDVAGQNRIALTAFAQDNRVSILSTPRLLVKSGSQASFDVGTEVPTVTMSTSSPQQTEGNTNLLQSIQYRKTGIILGIKPTVYSDNRIDLDITQEVSEALPLSSNATGNSPSIFNRSLTTSLSLRDGGSVVMGGLMSKRETNNDSGIPLVKDIPVLGNLFKTKSIKKGKTELVIMIVPYIIENDDQATSVSQAIVDRLEYLELEQFPKTITPVTPYRIPATVRPMTPAPAPIQRPIP